MAVNLHTVATTEFRRVMVDPHCDRELLVSQGDGLKQPQSVGVIAHPHTHALGDSTPPDPPQQNDRWDFTGERQAAQLVDLLERTGLGEIRAFSGLLNAGRGL